ncbi:MAG TPA: hypothetical protein VGD42_09370 [Lysobacter sp.]
MIRTLPLLAALLLATGAAAADGATGYRPSKIVMLQPSSLIGERVDVQPLADTLMAVQSAASSFRMEGKPDDWVNSCSIFLVLRPQSHLRTWSVCDGQDAPELDALIASSLPADAIATVREGSVILQLSAQGAPAGPQVGTLPLAWQQVAQVHGDAPLEMEQLVNQVWPM